MMTAEQYALLPEGYLRDIVDHDRRTVTIRDELARRPVVDIDTGLMLRNRAEVRKDLSGKAAYLYGRKPLRGDTGPGRPTSARA